MGEIVNWNQFEELFGFSGETQKDISIPFSSFMHSNFRLWTGPCASLFCLSLRKWRQIGVKTFNWRVFVFIWRHLQIECQHGLNWNLGLSPSPRVGLSVRLSRHPVSHSFRSPRCRFVLCCYFSHQIIAVVPIKQPTDTRTRTLPPLMRQVHLTSSCARHSLTQLLVNTHAIKLCTEIPEVH